MICGISHIGSGMKSEGSSARARTHTHTHTHTHAHTHTYTQTHTRTRTHTDIHTHTSSPQISKPQNTLAICHHDYFDLGGQKNSAVKLLRYTRYVKVI